MSIYKDQAWSMLLDEACRVVATRLRAEAHEFVMLKGSTIAGWLYPDPVQRTYTDLDILISPESEPSVVRLLEGLGYRPLLDRATLQFSSPEEQPLRNDLGVVIDLHTALQGVRLNPSMAWDILRQETVYWNWAGAWVPALAPHARAMHLALHLAQRGLEDTKAAKDLELGLDQLSAGTWSDAGQLAERLDALEAFAAGLTLLAKGEALASDLRLPQTESFEARMRANSASASAILLHRTLATPGWTRRIRLVVAALFPSREWLRLYYPQEAGTAWGLARLRLRRPWQVVWRMPSALRERNRYHG
jgi:hypothetical protein